MCKPILERSWTSNFDRSLNFKLIKELCSIEIQATFFFQTLDTSVLCHVQADIGLDTSVLCHVQADIGLDTSVLCHVQADIGEILENGYRSLTRV